MLTALLQFDHTNSCCSYKESQNPVFDFGYCYFPNLADHITPVSLKAIGRRSLTTQMTSADEPKVTRVSLNYIISQLENDTISGKAIFVPDYFSTQTMSADEPKSTRDLLLSCGYSLASTCYSILAKAFLSSTDTIHLLNFVREVSELVPSENTAAINRIIFSLAADLMRGVVKAWKSHGPSAEEECRKARELLKKMESAEEMFRLLVHLDPNMRSE
ncbi:hypothetical protein GIB67_022623 [Kingdonia uniflora]|uniref:Uncharacterized protein n=1 Tax=Kingdonia uniflora TaxID=39325 RepID=A0A7J7P834_9MAGN|nr:hypothetical protein GIB67_022623 [Kingdonia uniflora]